MYASYMYFIMCRPDISPREWECRRISNIPTELDTFPSIPSSAAGIEDRFYH